jgi:hypothetical protein
MIERDLDTDGSLVSIIQVWFWGSVCYSFEKFQLDVVLRYSNVWTSGITTVNS